MLRHAEPSWFGSIGTFLGQSGTQEHRSVGTQVETVFSRHWNAEWPSIRWHDE
jgi:hypothetical protein